MKQTIFMMEKKLRASQEEKEQLKLLAESGAGSESAGERGALEKDLTSQKDSGGKRTGGARNSMQCLPSCGGNCSRKSYNGCRPLN
uniref:Uncharacterized protein n=1 Tax=Amphimedon queenslandica TaxID=400682 RepID=A0A1X7VXQ4_AMPQE